jgi:hypothetical protein
MPACPPTHTPYAPTPTRKHPRARARRRPPPGDVPLDAGLLRQAAGLAQRLPAMDAAGFSDDYRAERADAMLAILLAAVTKGTAQGEAPLWAGFDLCLRLGRAPGWASCWRRTLRAPARVAPPPPSPPRAVNSLVEKYSVAYERGMGGKRGGKGGPSGLPSSLGGAHYGAGMMSMGPPMLL